MRVLILVDYYLPGFKSGGPARTIANIVDAIGDEVEFLIFTRDHDIGDSEPYSSVLVNSWNSMGKAKVFYASSSRFSLKLFRILLNPASYDILYLNSFFSPQTTGLALLVRSLGFCVCKPVIIAPRGEFSLGALQNKSIRKKIYIAATKLIGFYHNLMWQASTKEEASDIRSSLGAVAGNIYIAPDLTAMSCAIENGQFENSKYLRPTGPLRIIFISRISPMKNLDYLLRLMKQVKSEIEFAIYGPIEDRLYWEKCLLLIKNLPSNIAVTYYGEAKPERVHLLFSSADVFFFPTRGENFGHVIYESLASGTSVVLSDRTSWKADKDGAVTIIPLDDMEGWVSAIECWANFKCSDFLTQRRAAFNYAYQYSTDISAVERSRALFSVGANLEGIRG